ncbi:MULTISPECIES: hypothetical protein [Cupriavidus]|uniref:Uncharacterized protein n=1 Tax=Cupriavidus pinatubonensis (strain JMP 134 / LMG 1197) TaxID=264198 RepID=Q46PK9_CUPPJ|nr:MULTISPECIES: hypothetical protein [Cupriavidus]TPQ30365.1 hypothetical protein C2U69_31285 [Cupriavidus pinatubonensis]
MKSRTRSNEAWARFYILDERNEPVQVAGHGEWSRWMEENDPVFRRTVLEAAGSTVTTRFRGVSEAAPVDTPLFITRVAGAADPGGNRSYGASSLQAALAQHERIVQKLLRGELASKGME